MKRLTFFCILFIFSLSNVFSQDLTALYAFEKHFEQAKIYDKVSLYAECVEEINSALQISKEQKWLKREVTAGIFLAEVKRKTEDFKEGMSILNGLKNSVNFPALHVEKLGRIAALLNEEANELSYEQKFDTVRFYLDSVIALSEQLGLKKCKPVYTMNWGTL